MLQSNGVFPLLFYLSIPASISILDFALLYLNCLLFVLYAMYGVQFQATTSSHTVGRLVQSPSAPLATSSPTAVSRVERHTQWPPKPRMRVRYPDLYRRPLPPLQWSSRLVRVKSSHALYSLFCCVFSFHLWRVNLFTSVYASLCWGNIFACRTYVEMGKSVPCRITLMCWANLFSVI